MDTAAPTTIKLAQDIHNSGVGTAMHEWVFRPTQGVLAKAGVLAQARNGDEEPPEPTDPEPTAPRGWEVNAEVKITSDSRIFDGTALDGIKDIVITTVNNAVAVNSSQVTVSAVLGHTHQMALVQVLANEYTLTIRVFDLELEAQANTV